MNFSFLCLLVLASYVGNTVAHSWIACADYTEKNGADWDPEKCRGYARDSEKYALKESFGHDKGFDHKPRQTGNVCKTDYSETSYSSSYPKAVYYPGQQVVLVHPMKNHAAASCTGQYMPDFGSWLYYGDPKTNGKLSDYKGNVVSYLGKSEQGAGFTALDVYPKPGYQNAPKFCENTDKAMATYSLNIPETLAPGEYTFVWTWSFNNLEDLYSGCLDVIVAPTKQERDEKLKARNPRLSLEVPCGGKLSNEEEGSCPPDDNTDDNDDKDDNDDDKDDNDDDTDDNTDDKDDNDDDKDDNTDDKDDNTDDKDDYTDDKDDNTDDKDDNTDDKDDYTDDKDDNADNNGNNNGGYNNNDDGFCLPVLASQFSGSIDIGKPPAAIVSRKIKLDLVCDIESIVVWNGRVLDEKSDDGCYYVIQDTPDDVKSGMVKFMITYENCDFARYKPRARLVGEKRRSGN